MVKLIKVYDEKDSTVFEMAVVAMTEKGAIVRATLSLLGRRPSKSTVTHIIDTEPFGEGYLKEYRVIIEVGNEGDLRDKLKIDEAVELLENSL